MCGTCGCGEDDHITYRKPGENESKHSHFHVHPHMHGDEEHHHGHHHHHDHDYPHSHEHEDTMSDHAHQHTHAHHDHVHDDQKTDHVHTHDGHTHTHTLKLERNIMAKNDLIAERNRGYFDALNIVSLNLVSSPGSGKTSLLERTIRESAGRYNTYVIEGDQQTMNDAERIQSAGAPVIQVNTGNGCHLDALMVNKAMKALNVPQNSLLFIENVGNLVCPSLFDLGETKRVVIISVTEGDDKPAKYPTMFETAHLCVINKTDLLPYVDFDVEKAKQYALRVNPKLEFITLSVKSGEGFDAWYSWLDKLMA